MLKKCVSAFMSKGMWLLQSLVVMYSTKGSTWLGV